MAYARPFQTHFLFFFAVVILTGIGLILVFIEDTVGELITPSNNSDRISLEMNWNWNWWWREDSNGDSSTRCLWNGAGGSGQQVILGERHVSTFFQHWIIKFKQQSSLMKKACGCSSWFSVSCSCKKIVKKLRFKLLLWLILRGVRHGVIAAICVIITVSLLGDV